jgi:hypothetical protein
MLLSSENLRKRDTGMPYKSDRRLYLDKDNNVVEARDKNRRTLLVGEGGEIPMEDARRYGLVGDAPDAPTARLHNWTEEDAAKARAATEKPSGAPKKKA